jgi:hypothetical protein
MKRLLLSVTLSILLFSCGKSTEDLTKEVKQSMAAEFEKNEDYNVKIKDLSLIKKTNTEYSGILDTEESLKSDPSTKAEHRYSVEVVTDGKTFQWQTKTVN